MSLMELEVVLIQLIRDADELRMISTNYNALLLVSRSDLQTLEKEKKSLYQTRRVCNLDNVINYLQQGFHLTNTAGNLKPLFRSYFTSVSPLFKDKVFL